jgi:hypothetical protein
MSLWIGTTSFYQEYCSLFVPFLLAAAQVKPPGTMSIVEMARRVITTFYKVVANS